MSMFRKVTRDFLGLVVDRPGCAVLENSLGSTKLRGWKRGLSSLESDGSAVICLALDILLR